MHLVLRIAADMLSGDEEYTFVGQDHTRERHVSGAIVATVLEVWVRSIPFDIDAKLWRLFLDQFPSVCTSSVVTIEQWHACCVSLTASLVEVLWGRRGDINAATATAAGAGTTTANVSRGRPDKQYHLVIHWPHSNIPSTRLHCTARHLIFAWQHAYQLLQRPSTLSDPRLSIAVTRAVADMVRILVVFSASGKITFVKPRQARIALVHDNVLFIGKRM